MKKLILIIAFVLPFAAFGQKSPVDKLFEKYGNQDGFTTVNISGKLLGLAAGMDTSDEKATGDMLAKLKGIRILTVEDSLLNSKLDFYEELKKEGFFNDKSYEPLMEVTEKNEVVRFLAKDNGNNKLTELLLIVGGKENALISITGLIDPETIGKITNSLNIDIPNAKIKKK